VPTNLPPRRTRRPWRRLRPYEWAEAVVAGLGAGVILIGFLDDADRAGPALLAAVIFTVIVASFIYDEEDFLPKGRR